MTSTPTPPSAPETNSPRASLPWWSVIGPGILVAATGVGTGDLVTGALAGTRLGVMVLWAAVLGALFKFLLNEGLARWQLATDQTILEGVGRHFGRLAIGVFLAYLLLWTYFVAAALMSACGAAMHAILPLSRPVDPDRDKLIYGVAHSLLAVGLVELGGYRLFEKVMKVCIGIMFLTVLITAVAVRPDWSAVLSGLFVPRLPALSGEELRWTIGLMGGVGGTVTILCYGYWIREEGRQSPEFLPACRVDLAVGYVMTALFGIAMVIIGSQVSVSGKSVTLLVTLADTLREQLGSGARWVFLIGAWGAIFSSLLGVWQSVPYLFTDTLHLLTQREATADSVAGSPRRDKWTYRIALYLMATLPIVGMAKSFATVQLAYAICGALFIPLLSIALLLLNGSSARIGPTYRNRPVTTISLIVAILVFVVYGYLEVRSKLG
jgi:Mn2+/Fe2+ NRAMP family transporter